MRTFVGNWMKFFLNRTNFLLKNNEFFLKNKLFFRNEAHGTRTHNPQIRSLMPYPLGQRPNIDIGSCTNKNILNS